MYERIVSNRREMIRQSAWLTAAFLTPGLFAEELMRTPRQTEGPFYPDHLPLDADNDLVVVGNSLTPAVGSVTHLTGKVLTTTGEPVRNAVVEIWQVDANAAYLHTGSSGHSKRDKNFQGFGRFETNAKGEYRFRTIKPVAYDTRTPHIHVAIDKGGKRLLTTQIYVAGEPLNEKDGVLRRMGDPREREALIRPFRPVSGSKHGEFAVDFPIVIGGTPEDVAGDEFRRRRS